MTRARPEVLLACVLASFCVGEALLLPVPGSRAVAVVCGAALGAVFAWQRRWPVGVAVAAEAVIVGREILDAAPDGSYGPWLALPFLFFGAAAYAERRWAAWLFVAALASAMRVALFHVRPEMPPPEMQRAMWITLVGLGACGSALGVLLRDRSARLRRLRASVGELELRVAAAGEVAAADEQRRVAAQLDGVVRALAADVAPRLATATAESLQAVALSARAAMTQMREVLGRLQDAGPLPPGSAAPPAAAALASAPATPPSAFARRAERPLRAVRAHAAVTALVLIAIADQTLVPIAGPPLPVRLALAVLIPLPLILRDRAPLVAVTAFGLLLAAGDLLDVFAGPVSLPAISVLVAAFLAGAIPAARRAVLAGALVVVLPLSSSFVTGWGPLAPTAAWVLQLGVAWTAGRVLRARLAAAAASRTELARLDLRRRRAQDRAAALERSRLAREIHDVLGHDVVSIALHADVARVRARQDPEAARAAVAAAQAAAADAVRELDRLTRLTAADVAAPGLADLPALVSRVRAAGVDVELRVALPTPGAIPARLGHAVYRIVQEALTNVAKHASGASASVELAAADGQLQVRVRNAAGLPVALGQGGLGQETMRERAAEQGGRLRSGPDPAGGWQVTGTFPLR